MKKSNSYIKKSKSSDSLCKKKSKSHSKKNLRRSSSSSPSPMNSSSGNVVKSHKSAHSTNSIPKVSNRSKSSKSLKSLQSLGIQRRPSSVTSLASQYNLVTGRYTANVKLSETLSQNTGHINQYGHSLYDCALVYLICPFHKKVALSKIVNKGLFLPFGPIRTGESWLNATASIIQKILNIRSANERALFTEPIVIDILRIQMPIYFEFITRVTYQAKLTNEAHNANYCNDNPTIAWFTINEIISKVYTSDYLGPEPALFYNNNNTICREVTVLDVLLFCIQGSRIAEGEVLHTSGYKENDVLLLYADYLQHSYPSEFMTFHSFKTYLAKCDVDLGSGYDLVSIFKSFDCNDNKFINFNEFLLGLSMVEKGLFKQDSKQICEFKTNYIFRYYSRNNDNHLSEAEFNKLVADIKHQDNDSYSCKFKKKFINGKLTKQALNLMLNSMASSESKPIGLYQFGVSPLTHLKSKRAYASIQLRQLTPSQHKNAIQAKLQRARELCVNCRSKQYTLSCHMVKMSNEGQVYEPVANRQPDIERMPQHKRGLSERYFTKSFVCNQMVDLVRAFACKKRINKSKMTIQSADWECNSVREQCVQKILKICSEAKCLFQNSSRVVKVTSSCYVIGDIHGNLHDLLVYEKAIWKLGPYFNSANFLFLGDYVDRGDYSVECILYLLCMKLLVPDRIFMLRGNHECRSLQKEFTFYTECKQKFGDLQGEEVWEAFNDVFDVMPLCAIIDESIFCAHGGIPSCAMKVEQIMSVKSPLKDPENESEIALEILWNDPVTNQEYIDLLKSSPGIAANLQHGFLANTKRGTACYYSEDALNNFLTANGLSHVIRAHEVIPAGYQYHMGGRCITIFSCSHYCGGINEAAVAFIHDSKIRVMKVDTKL